MNSITFLAKDNLKAWFRARGFWLIIIVALVPPALTGAWVGTHQDDVAVIDLQHDGGDIEAGQLVNFTATIRNEWDHAVGSFNATMRAGFFEERNGQLAFREQKAEEFTIDGLGPGQATTIAMNWTVSFGTFIVQALIDTDDAIAELEERNNDRHIQIQSNVGDVEFPVIRSTTGTGGPDVDVRLSGLRFEPEQVYARELTNVTVTVHNDGPADLVNATLHFDVHRITITPQGSLGVSRTTATAKTETINLTAGESRDVTFEWEPNSVSGFVPLLTLDPGAHNETDPSDNSLGRPIIIDRQFLYEEPEAKATAKDFYRNVLELLHLRLLIPLIALFYAGSVIEDEREKGHLPYLMTRPMPRWQIPVVRFLVTFLVAGAALLVGILATFFVLLGTPDQTPGYVGWPLGFSLLALAIYSAVFTLVGVVARRPYMVGLLYVIGFEAVILVGQNILVNGRPLLQDWVLNLSLNHWVQTAFGGWSPSGEPLADEAWRAFYVIIGIAIASIVGAAAWMRRREFPE